MPDFISNIINFIKFMAKTHRLNMDANRIRRIRKTYFRVFLMHDYDSKKRIANIMGFKINFCTYNDLLYLFNEIFINQEYFFITKNKTPYIIDCGSNIGMSILYFKTLYPEASILAFEPNQEAFSCLENNVLKNSINKVLFYKKALSNKEGEIDFYYDQDILGSIVSSTKQERMPKQKMVVETSKLSSYINREVDFLKMDIEGAETEVIEELINMGKLNYVKQIVIEYHHHIVKDSDIFSKMLQLLENAGFGYQLESSIRRPLTSSEFQDIVIYAYNKNASI